MTLQDDHQKKFSTALQLTKLYQVFRPHNSFSPEPNVADSVNKYEIKQEQEIKK